MPFTSKRHTRHDKEQASLQLIQDHKALHKALPAKEKYWQTFCRQLTDQKFRPNYHRIGWFQRWNESIDETIVYNPATGKEETKDRSQKRSRPKGKYIKKTDSSLFPKDAKGRVFKGSREENRIAGFLFSIDEVDQRKLAEHKYVFLDGGMHDRDFGNFMGTNNRRNWIGKHSHYQVYKVRSKTVEKVKEYNNAQRDQEEWPQNQLMVCPSAAAIKAITVVPPIGNEKKPISHSGYYTDRNAAIKAYASDRLHAIRKMQLASKLLSVDEEGLPILILPRKLYYRKGYPYTEETNVEVYDPIMQYTDIIENKKSAKKMKIDIEAVKQSVIDMLHDTNPKAKILKNDDDQKLWDFAKLLIKHNEKELFQELLQQGKHHGFTAHQWCAKKSYSSGENKFLIHWAAEQGRAEILTMLLQDSNASYKEDILEALELAFKNKHYACVQTILTDGRSYLSKEAVSFAHDKALKHNKPDLVHLLVTNYAEHLNNKTALNEKLDSINTTKKSHFLNEAMRRRDDVLVKELISQNAGLNTKDSKGFTPMAYAIRERLFTYVDLMIAQKGALSEKVLQDSLIALLEIHKDECAIQCAIKLLQQHEFSVNDLIIKLGTGKEESLLHFAARIGNARLAELLIDERHNKATTEQDKENANDDGDTDSLEVDTSSSAAATDTIPYAELLQIALKEKSPGFMHWAIQKQADNASSYNNKELDVALKTLASTLQQKSNGTNSTGLQDIIRILKSFDSKGTKAKKQSILTNKQAIIKIRQIAKDRLIKGSQFSLWYRTSNIIGKGRHDNVQKLYEKIATTNWADENARNDLVEFANKNTFTHKVHRENSANSTKKVKQTTFKVG